VTTEQRLAEALAAAKDYEVSPDLWSRVMYSIEEQRDHRRRLMTTAAAIVVVVAVAVAVVAATVERVGGRARVDWRALEAVEFIALVVLVVSLGPAIRRFGRGFVSDLIVTNPGTGTRLLGLLDLAYYLVFAGYILATSRLERPIAYLAVDIGDQLEDALLRVAGLLLAMGVLHALTLVALPVVALVFNSTRAGTKLPRWLVVILIVVGVLIAVQVPGAILGAIGSTG